MTGKEDVKAIVKAAKAMIKAIEAHVQTRGEGWKFIYGRQILDKKAFLRKLHRDANFRVKIVEMVSALSINILDKGGKTENACND